jgi:transposase
MSIGRNTHMTNAAVEVITSVQRRRRWSRAEKERLVAALLEPGAVASAIAREAGIHVSQLFGWRRQLCGRQTAGFAAVHVTPEASGPGTIEIEFTAGARMRVRGAVDPAVLSAAIRALSGGKRA